MSEYRPFIDDKNDLSRFEGQRYVVLRPVGEVCDAFERVRRVIRDKYSGLSISYIARAHVTLGGFPKGTRLESVKELVAHWTSALSSLHLEVERVGVFPSPSQIVVVQVRKTPELFYALTSLRSLAAQQRLRGFNDVPAEDWIFHMSVGYCSSLSPVDWEEVTRFVGTLAVPLVRCALDEAEVVAFDNDREYSGGVYRFS